MRIVAVEPGRRAPRTPQRRRGPLTPIKDRRYRATFVAPVTRPGQDTHRGCWAATSVDELWEYLRREDHDAGHPWSVRLRPTGQVREDVSGSLDGAREATASGALLADMAGEAGYRAFTGSRDERAVGQWWLAVHMRLAGADEADGRCRCGGLLVEVPTPDGSRWTHVDACGECWTHGRGYDQGAAVLAAGWTCPGGDPHRFCTDPVPVQCGHWRTIGCTGDARPTGGGDCGGQPAGECCGACCRGE